MTNIGHSSQPRPAGAAFVITLELYCIYVRAAVEVSPLLIGI
jgi:hypothetical protein